jgi:hypothetical protein
MRISAVPVTRRLPIISPPVYTTVQDKSGKLPFEVVWKVPRILTSFLLIRLKGITTTVHIATELVEIAI